MKTSNRAVSTRAFVVVVLITFAISVARLVLELRDVLPASSRTAGGGGAWLGIAWLPPIIGMYFANRLIDAGQAPARRLRVLPFALLAFALAIGAAVVNFSRYRDGDQTLMTTFIIGGVAWLAIALVLARTWPALAWLMFGYGVLARLGVVVITIVCVQQGWDTHYTQFGTHEKPYVPADAKQTMLLAAVPQLGIWIAYTVIAGLFGGGIVALVRRPRS